jgi:hypothetical protein
LWGDFLRADYQVEQGWIGYIGVEKALDEVNREYTMVLSPDCFIDPESSQKKAALDL